MDVVVHMSQPHLCLYSFLLDLFRILQVSLSVEILLYGRKQLEPVLRGIILHVLEEVAVDHEQGEFLEGLKFSKIHK